MMDIWDGKFTKDVTKQYKISLCTTCMNRLYNLKDTLTSNIQANIIQYPNIEFVILDYNSSDGLGDWIKNNFTQYIKTGQLVYYRTEEPKFYSMTHSRNIAFKVATGDIASNVDADNFTFVKDKPTNSCFAHYLNMLANEQPEKAIFAKGKRLLHGRLGFYRQEFIDVLGGYNEEITNYGYDEKDLLLRAWNLGFKLMWFGGQYVSRIKTSRKEKVVNMEIKNWKQTENLNKAISAKNIENGIFKANIGRQWGKAILVKNFKEEIEIC